MNKQFFEGYFFGGIMAFVTYAVMQLFNLGGLSILIWIIMLLIFHFISEEYSRHSK